MTDLHGLDEAVWSARIELTGQQKAEARGLKSFDFAIPQDWWDAAHDRTGLNPAGHVVWCYDDAAIFGHPRALDEIGDKIVGIMAMNAR